MATTVAMVVEPFVRFAGARANCALPPRGGVW